MSKFKGSAVLFLTAVAFFVLLAAGLPAEAQGCAMCKLSAEAAGEEAAKALDYGIFILLVPTVIFFLGIFYWAFSHRDRSLADQMEAEELSPAPLAERPPQDSSLQA
jgi:hypothetical protein